MKYLQTIRANSLNKILVAQINSTTINCENVSELQYWESVEVVKVQNKNNLSLNGKSYSPV